MKTEHTPGPWHYGTASHEIYSAGISICRINPGMFCGIHMPSAETQLANARLIAAAPDMFDELATKAAACDHLRAENAKLGRLAFDLAEACRAFLEAQDSPAPRDLLTLAAIKASAALAKVGQ